MTDLEIGVIVGSLRANSFNKRLANALEKMAPEGLRFKHLEIGNLPLYNQDDDANPAESVRRFKSEIHSADALLFVTPEYNRSMPGVLKNALDHASRPYGQSAWAGKPAGVVGASIGATGTALAQQHLRNVLAYLDVHVMGQPEVYLQVSDASFDGEGGITREDTKQFLQGWMNTYANWIKTFISR